MNKEIDWVIDWVIECVMVGGLAYTVFSISFSCRSTQEEHYILSDDSETYTQGFLGAFSEELRFKSFICTLTKCRSFVLRRIDLATLHFVELRKFCYRGAQHNICDHDCGLQHCTIS